MGATFARVKQWINGETLTHTDLNAEFDNFINNLSPAGMDDYSSSQAIMQTIVDPYPLGAESYATSLQGEIERLRYSLKLNNGGDYWYYDPPYIFANHYASLSAAVTAIGATVTTLIVKDTQTLTANLTIPSTLTLSIMPGGSIAKDSTYTLTINGPFPNPGLRQVFSGFSAGDVTFGAKTPYIQAEWFGEVGDNSTDNTAARAVLFGSAIASAGRKVVYGPGTFIGNYSTDITLNPWSITIEGQSPTGTQIKGKSGANADVFGINVGQTDSGIWPTYWSFRNLTIDGNSANNSSGSCLNLFQVNELKLDNVVLQNGKDYNLKADTVIGITVDGHTIWGNTVDASVGSGAVYLSDATDIIFNGTAFQSFSGASQWPVTIINTDGAATRKVTFNDFYIEDNKNGVKVDDQSLGGLGISVIINNPSLIGLSSTGGTLFDITGDPATRVIVNGGNAYNSWDTNWIKTSGTPYVLFDNVNGISNSYNFQNDLSGYTAIWGAPEYYNYIPNGDFEFWDTTVATIPWDAGGGIYYTVGSGGTYDKDTTNFKGGAASWKYDNSGASADSTTTYAFRAHEINQVKGKYLNSTIWVKGDAAAASDLYITVTAASYGGGGTSTFTSDANNGTDWERLRVVAYIPADATAITITSRVYDPRTASVDLWTTTANYAGPYTPKDSGLYGSVTWNPGAINFARANATLVTVTGAAVKDTVTVYPPYSLTYAYVQGYVNSANSVAIVAGNPVGLNGDGTTAITLGSGVWTVRVDKQ